MDIDLLSKMVKELILDRDEVTLPGVGTFVAEIVPASFSDKGYTINPPYRRLSFRQRQNADDSSLVNLYVASNGGVDPEQAKKIVTDFLSEMKEILKTRKNIVFPGLGRLRSTKENNFFFVSDEDLDIFPDGFALEPISLKTHVETSEDVSAVIRRIGEEILPEPPESDPESVGVQMPEDPQETEESHESEELHETEDVHAAELSREPEATHETEVTREPEAVQEAEVSQETEITKEPETAHEPEAEHETEVAQEAVAAQVTGEESQEKKQENQVRPGQMPLWVKTLLWIAGIFLLLLVAYIVAARLFPDFFDSILYSNEELRILNY